MPGHLHRARLQQRQLVGDVAGQRAQPHPFRCRRRHAQAHQRSGGNRSDAHRVHFGRSAVSTRSSMPISAARISTAATAGAEVKLTASNFSSAMPATSWSKSPLRGTGCQRYTRIGTTSAPAARSSSRNSGNGSQSVGGAVQLDRDALAGDAALDQVVQQLARRLGLRRPFLRQARCAQAPVAFGPRDTMRALPSAAIRSLASPQPSAAATQPRSRCPWWR